MKFNMFGYSFSIVKSRRNSILQKKASGFKSKKWTEIEETAAVAMLQGGSTKIEVAEKLERTVASILTRRTMWRKKGLL